MDHIKVDNLDGGVLFRAGIAAFYGNIRRISRRTLRKAAAFLGCISGVLRFHDDAPFISALGCLALIKGNPVPVEVHGAGNAILRGRYSIDAGKGPAPGQACTGPF